MDLSTEFDSGGGSTSMQLPPRAGRLHAHPVLDGQVGDLPDRGRDRHRLRRRGHRPRRPAGRADYYDQLPSIFVDRPAYGAAIGNPGRVAGNANVFEATFRVALIDAGGRTLVDQQVMATCGTGCRGTFDVSLRYTVSKGQWGTLRAYNLSAKDGSPEDIRDYPVWLTPAS